MTTAMKSLVRRQKRSALHPRRQQLLTVIEEQGGAWKTRQVMRLYRDRSWGCCRSTARGDLQLLARQGFLAEHGADNDRWYSLAGGHR